MRGAAGHPIHLPQSRKQLSNTPENMPVRERRCVTACGQFDALDPGKFRASAPAVAAFASGPDVGVTRRASLAAIVPLWPIAAMPLPAATFAAQREGSLAVSHWFTTSDAVRLHYLEAGSARPGVPTLVFIPGWTMPAWIWQAQIDHFATRHRVIAFDPRGQGRSAAPASGYDYGRRAADIAELLAAAQAEQVVLVGWSLGVLESLQYMHDARAAQAAGPASPVRALVLVDNSVGVGDPPRSDPTFFTRLRNRRRETMAAFVGSMFKRPPDPRWTEQLLESTLRLPLSASIDLLRQPRVREFWRDTLYAIEQPVLYAYTPKFAQQGDLVKQHKPAIETRLFAEAAHALFVDEAAAFNQMLEGFVARVQVPLQSRSQSRSESRAPSPSPSRESGPPK